MSVLVFLHKNEYVEWQNVWVYSLEVEKSKANQKIAGHAGTKKTKMKLS